MKITVNPFDKKSVAEAEKILRQYQKDFETKKAEFVKRLADIGVHTATSVFHASDYDGTKDISVSLEKTKDGYAVVAAGETVGFVEFGTGIRHREWDNTGMDYTPPPHGSYGKGHGKWKHGWYFYPNEGAAVQHTYGNPPAEAMLQARDNMIMYVTEIAREVWR